MPIFGTSNTTLANTMAGNQEKNFKDTYNLLTLQDNHVEEFLKYHGVDFFTAIEQLMEDVMERVMSQMLVKLEFMATESGDLKVNEYSLREYERITKENIELDIQNIMNAALNEEVVLQRQMAKNSFLEGQGMSAASQGPGVNFQQQGMSPQGQQIQGQPMGGQMNQAVGGMGNNSGYPVPPMGYDQYNNPYWYDQNTGQITYEMPAGGMGLGTGIKKAAAWAKFLM
jgi:hypothetical protein